MSDAHNEAANGETRLRATLDSLLEGAQIIDRDWRYVYVNPAAARHGGRSVDELLGQTMMEAYPGIDRTPMFAALRHSMVEREPAVFDKEFPGPDGSIGSFQWRVQPVPEGLFVLSLDITGRRRAEEELRTSRARFEAVIEHLHEGLVICDFEGNFLHWNQSALAMLGLSGPPERSPQRPDVAPLFELSTAEGEPLPAEQWPFARVLRGEDFQDLELRVSAPSLGSQRIFAYSGATVRYEDEALAFVTIRDVTERKELEKQFVRAQRMECIGALAGGIAHDLNNILMPILMGATNLRRLDPEGLSARTIDNIERSAKRGADLVKQVLSFARGTEGPAAAIDVGLVIRDVDAIVRSTFPENIVLSIDIADDLHRVRADFTQVLQIVLNLCVNARDAMSGGGRITISARNAPVSEHLALAKGVSGGHYIVVEVADEGSGMTAAVQKRIFEPFFTTKDVGKGTGLGLFTVQDIVRNHGGFTDVFSEPGRGTTFRVFLVAQAGEAVAAAEPDVEDLPRGNGELIMVVDDEVSILSVAKQMLEAFGYEVVSAADGAEAIAIYARDPSAISLVVTDMMMPIFGGPALIAALLRMNPGLPIVATSGTSNEDWVVRAGRAGARHFLAKPYTAPGILRMLAGVLDHRPGTQ